MDDSSFVEVGWRVDSGAAKEEVRVASEVGSATSDVVEGSTKEVVMSARLELEVEKGAPVWST